MIYFTSDPHFNHYNIIKSCKRPFSSSEEMDLAILNNINTVVESNDILYVLGDWAFKMRDWSGYDKYRSMINCRNVHLIRGGHDHHPEIAVKFFTSVEKYKEIVWQGTNIILFHNPIARWERKHYGSWHLHGHCHGSYEAGLIDSISNGLCLDVGVDVHGFKPLSYEQVKIIMENKKLKMKWEEDYRHE